MALRCRWPQVGGAIFSDIHYREHYYVAFPFALTVLCTVTSRPTPSRIVLDAGKKTMSGDAAMPEPIGLPAMKAIKLSAEHVTIELEQPSHTPRVGERLSLSSVIRIPRFTCTTRSSGSAAGDDCFDPPRLQYQLRRPFASNSSALFHFKRMIQHSLKGSLLMNSS